MINKSLNIIRRYLKIALRLHGNSKFLLLGICIFYFVISIIYAIACLVNYGQYQVIGDLAIFTNGIWQYSLFKFPFMDFHLHRYWLGDHFHPLLIILSPFFWIYPDAKTLLVLQPFIMLSAIIPLHLIGYKKSKSFLFSFAICLAYAFYIPLQRTLFYGFHEIIFLPPLLAWMYYFYINENKKKYYISMILLLMIKEEVGFLVATFGLYILLFSRKWRMTGLKTLIIGICYSIIIIKIVIPFIGGNYLYSNYGKMGKSINEVLISIVSKPTLLWEIFTTPGIKLEVIKETFWPYAYLPVIHPFGLLLSFEQLFSRFADYGTINRWRNDLHYAAPMAIIVSLASIISSTYYINLIKKHKEVIYVIVALIIIYLTRIEQINKSAILLIKRPQFWQRSEWMRQNDEALSLIPREASVATQPNLRPYVAARKETYSLAEINKAEYVVLDLRQDQSVLNYHDQGFDSNNWEYMESAMLEKVKMDEMEIIYHQGMTYLFKRIQ